jgi:hypothetical protein
MIKNSNLEVVYCNRWSASSTSNRTCKKTEFASFLTRHQSPQPGRIEGLSTPIKVSNKKLKIFSKKNHLNKPVENDIQTSNMTAKPAPYSANPTPVEDLDNKTTSYPKISTSYASDDSIFYLKEPKIHAIVSSKRIQRDHRQDFLSSKKVFIKKTGAFINDQVEKPRASSRCTCRPVKSIFDLILIKNKPKPKGKIKRGLCINLRKSPVPMTLHNIKLVI